MTEAMTAALLIVLAACHATPAEPKDASPEFTREATLFVRDHLRFPADAPPERVAREIKRLERAEQFFAAFHDGTLAGPTVRLERDAVLAAARGRLVDLRGGANQAQHVSAYAGAPVSLPRIDAALAAHAARRDPPFRAARVDILPHASKIVTDLCNPFTAEAWTRYLADAGAHQAGRDPDVAVVGKLIILKLRDDWLAGPGEGKPLDEFHDAFLALGCAPLASIRRALVGSGELL